MAVFTNSNKINLSLSEILELEKSSTYVTTEMAGSMPSNKFLPLSGSLALKKSITVLVCNKYTIF